MCHRARWLYSKTLALQHKAAVIHETHEPSTTTYSSQINSLRNTDLEGAADSFLFLAEKARPLSCIQFHSYPPKVRKSKSDFLLYELSARCFLRIHLVLTIPGVSFVSRRPPRRPQRQRTINDAPPRPPYHIPGTLDRRSGEQQRTCTYRPCVVSPGAITLKPPVGLSRPHRVRARLVQSRADVFMYALLHCTHSPRKDDAPTAVRVSFPLHLIRSSLYDVRTYSSIHLTCCWIYSQPRRGHP